MEAVNMRQLIFPNPMTCTHLYPDGRQERVRYGQYESIMIVAENGRRVDLAVLLVVPNYYVTEVEKSDGTVVVFDEPWIERREYSAIK